MTTQESVNAKNMKKSELRQLIREEIQKLHEEETLQWMIPMGWPDGMDCGFCYEQGCGCNLKTGCSDAIMGENCQNPDGWTPHDESTGVGDMWLDGPMPFDPKPPFSDEKIINPKGPKRPGGSRPRPNPKGPKRPGGSRPRPFNPQPRGGVMSYMGPQAGGGLTGANTPGGPRTR